MNKARTPRPLIKRIPVDPIKYYSIVGELMVDLMANRPAQVIVQRSGSIKLIKNIDGKPILINDINDLRLLAAQGGLDFMASVKPMNSNRVDTLVVDVKVKQTMFNIPEGYLMMHLAVNAIKLGLEALGIHNSMPYFDGMNGFKVLAKLTDQSSVDLKVASRILKVIIEAAQRVLKRFSRLSGLMDDVTLGINTLSKVKVFRVPLSMHWSTKLSAIPIPGFCIKNFSLISAEPVKVMDNVNLYSFIRSIKPNDTNLNSWLTGEDYLLIYRVKSYILSNIRLEC